MAEFDASGNLIPPIGTLDPDCPPVEEDVDIYMGSVNDLYANCDGASDGTDMFYDDPDCPDSCASIGGTLPPELEDFINNDSLTTYLNEIGIDSIAQVYDSLLAIEDTLQNYIGNPLDTLFSMGAFPSQCDSITSKGSPPQPNGPSPFQGRDIVFIHGYRLVPLGAKIDYTALGNNANNFPRWPRDRDNEFINPNGYWKAGANQYWQTHIKEYLKVDADGGNPGNIYINRFLVVAHPSPQSGIVAAHAILWQIAKAMRDGTGVIKCSSSDGRDPKTFGENGIVIISHSAGALFTNVSMSIADIIRKNPLLSLKLGDIGYIADRVDIHIALQGAFAGSNYATGILAAATLPPLRSMVKTFLKSSTDPKTSDLPWLYTSQSLDMAIPHFIYGGPLFDKLCNLAPSPLNPFCYFVGKNLIQDVPMPVITVAGGHPSSYGISDPMPGDHSAVFQILGKMLFHHGFDDGVLSTDGQAGNHDSRLYYPNRYLARPGLATLVAYSTLGPVFGGLINERVYDMGIHRKLDFAPDRAIGFYLDQKIDVLVSSTIRHIAAGLSPSVSYDDLWPALSPPLLGIFDFTSAGSVPWLSTTGMVQPVLVSRIPGVKSYDALKRNDATFSFIQSSADHFQGSSYIKNPNDNRFENYEATNGITNGEEVRVITDNSIYAYVSPDLMSMQKEEIRGHKITFKIPWFPKKKTFTLWVWKRKYHLLEGWRDKHQLDYVYEYILK